ncbi:MAG TPA: HEAT repeat domain-containing protein [Desulfobulbus sp.]|nr:HEAT repeat domain-containing protein [Desulfobulbus sp.]
MGTRAIKKKIFSLLSGKDLEQVLADLGNFPAKQVINVLFSAICRDDDLVRWHAVSAMGVMVARLAGEEMEEARIIMRRLLWSLNDESGGIGWGAPESMAEIMHRHAGLAWEYIHMLISYARPDGPELEQDGNYLEHEILQQGLLWGFDRLCDRRRDLLLARGLTEDIPPYLHAGDHVVRGLALKVGLRLGTTFSQETLRRLMADDSAVPWYHEGEFLSFTISSLARTALGETR